MKDFDQKEFDHLIATKQYFPAVWRLIDAGRAEATSETIRKVSEVVAKASADGCVEQLGKIMRQFSRWVDADASAAALTVLNETTEIDLHPDVL